MARVWSPLLELRRVLLGVALLAEIVASTGCSGKPNVATTARKLVIIGVDGMDPKLTRRYMDEGLLPNLSRLAERGSFVALQTVDPPQSPVAWSAFITGLDSTGHGIFDFIHRDPVELKPYLSTSQTREPLKLELGDFALPLGAPDVELLRHGTAFWQVLEAHGIAASAIKIPANFPPAPTKANVSTSDMGTPDLLGTYGTYQVVTSDAHHGPAKGGLVRLASRIGEDGYRATLIGPPSPFSRRGKPLELPLEIHVDDAEQSAVILLKDQPVLLHEGEWSTWIPIGFDTGALSSTARGMVRIYLKALAPELMLYVSPINLDPLAPLLPLSSPPEFIQHQARKAGRFFTQGLAEDTKALASGALNDDEFLAQSLEVFAERGRLLEQSLDEYQSGLLFFYISSVDQLSHMFWRSLEPDASSADARYANVIPEMYQRIDALIGHVLERVGPDTPVVVMSDHGFASYRYKVNLNTWLTENGYQSRIRSSAAGPSPLSQIDWDNTQAYALGLNQVFVNVAGREAHGIVPPAQRDALVRRLRRELEAWRQAETGTPIVTQTFSPNPGEFADRAPDLIVGFNAGFRSSDESALGELGAHAVERNLGKWSGDHCIDPAHVPGVLLSSIPLDKTDVSLFDFFPTILQYFAIAPEQTMRGSSFWNAKTLEARKSPAP